MKPSALAKASFAYTIAALVAGVFFREFTKFNDFTGATTLSLMHVHLFVLGTVLFLALAALSLAVPLLQDKRFKGFFIIHNIALPCMVAMLLVRGIDQVVGLGMPSAAISGIAGLTHAALAVSLVLAGLCCVKAFKSVEAAPAE